MLPRNLPQSSAGIENSEDPATAAILAGGCADGVPSLAVRYWSSHGSPAMPVFITWLLGIGRSCLMVKYRRRSLRGRASYVDTGSGLRSTQSPLDQARLEAMRVSRVLQLRLKRSVPVSAALALPAWCATGASSEWPAGAASLCSGTWSGIPPPWPVGGGRPL